MMCPGGRTHQMGGLLLKVVPQHGTRCSCMKATAAAVEDDDNGGGDNADIDVPAATQESADIVDAGPAREVRHGLVIFDCRSYSAAAANSIKGGGLEDVSRYVGCKQVRTAAPAISGTAGSSE